MPRVAAVDVRSALALIDGVRDLGEVREEVRARERQGVGARAAELRDELGAALGGFEVHVLVEDEAGEAGRHVRVEPPAHLHVAGAVAVLEVEEVRASLGEADLRHAGADGARARGQDVELPHLLEDRHDAGEELVVEQIVREDRGQVVSVRLERRPLRREVILVEELVLAEELVICLEEQARGLLEELPRVREGPVVLGKENVGPRRRGEPHVGAEDLLA